MKAEYSLRTVDLVRMSHSLQSITCKGTDLHTSDCLDVQILLNKVAIAEVDRAVSVLNEGKGVCNRVPNMNAAAMLNTAARMIALPADGCRECLGEGKVPSSFMPGVLVPCVCTQNREG